MDNDRCRAGSSPELKDSVLVYSGRKGIYISLRPDFLGELSEWLKEHAWKACVPERVPRVRIPHSPQKVIKDIS